MRPAIGFGRGNWLRFVIEIGAPQGPVRTGVVFGAHLNLRNEANFVRKINKNGADFFYPALPCGIVAG